MWRLHVNLFFTSCCAFLSLSCCHLEKTKSTQKTQKESEFVIASTRSQSTVQHVVEKCIESQSWLQNTENAGSRGRWHRWFSHGPVATLFSNSAHLSSLGPTSDTLLSLAEAKHKQGADSRQADSSAKRNFQRCTRTALARLSQPDPAHRMRHKLNRWNLFSPQLTATRCLDALSRLTNLVSHRISAAILRTMWNASATARRFQPHQECLLGCGHFSSEDSIEHYAVCHIAVDFASSVLGIPTANGNESGTYGRRKIRVP